MASELYM